MAIFIAIAIPSYTTIKIGNSKKAAVETFEGMLIRGRSTAIALGGRGIFTHIRGGVAYTFGMDYPPYSGTFAPDTTLFRINFPMSVKINASAKLVFDSRGFLVDVDSLPTTSSLTLSFNSVTFNTGTVYTTGLISYP